MQPRQPTRRRSPRAPRPEQAKPGERRRGRRREDRLGQDQPAHSRRCRCPRAATCSCRPARPGTLFALEAPARRRPGGPPGLTVHRYDLRQRRADVVASGVRFFEISANGEKTLTAQADAGASRRCGRWLPAGAAAAARVDAAGARGTGRRAPGRGGRRRAQHRQPSKCGPIRAPSGSRCITTRGGSSASSSTIPNLHGLDLAAAIKKYEPYLESVMSRRDLSYVFADMMGEITVGHLGVGGGDLPETQRRADRAARLRLPHRERTLPLRAASTTARTGTPISRAADAARRQRAGGRVPARGQRPRAARRRQRLQLLRGDLRQERACCGSAPNADGAGARDVTVVPVANEARLRNLAWIEDNRRKVDKMTNGRVAYVYMPDTAFGGLHELHALLLRAGRQGGGDHRRAVQRRRRAGDRHHRAAQSQDDESGGHARRRGRGAAAGRDLRPEGDDHQRARGLGRRCDAELFPPRRRRQVDRQAHVGRAGRPRRRAAADGWRLRERAELRACGVRPANGMRRTSASRPTSRSSTIPSWCARARIRSSRRRSKW